MKDNIREALFNLVGAWMPNRHVFDLFAGTGAVGLEALSRGANHVTLIERHIPTAKMIRDNVELLDVQDRTTIITSDAFFWVRKFVTNSKEHPTLPWAIFCCPPYDCFVKQKSEILDMIDSLLRIAPPDSLLAVESDSRFSPSELPDPDKWRVRNYSPAQICILRPVIMDDSIMDDSEENLAS